MSRVHRILVAALFIFAFLLAVCFYDISRFLWTPLVKPGQPPLHYVLAPGMNTVDLATDLQRNNFLTRPTYFVWLARLSGLSTVLQAGEYLFQPGTRPYALLKKIARGDVIVHRLALIEGWNFAQVLAAVRAAPGVVGTMRGLSFDEMMLQITGQLGYPEGLFFPDTYEFTAGTTDIVLLKRAYRAMQTKLAQIWAHRVPGLPYQTAYEALTAASIIEKETALDQERALVSSVLVNRLHKGMRLQCDPTVIYGLGETYTGRLLRSHLQQDTPYNTYTRYGLPPTPIAMPGEQSLLAAVKPAVTDYFYFYAKGDGSHQFSATLKEQNAAIRKYRPS